MLGHGIGSASEVELLFDDVAEADAIEAIYKS
jgi:hypothetical protein